MISERDFRGETMSRVAHRQLTIRIPEGLYDRAAKIARKRGTSLNQLAIAGLDEIASQEKARRLRMAYESLSADASANDVEPCLAAQAEVIDDE
jgi:hypothetical protein